MLKKFLLIVAMLLFLSAGTAAAQDAYPPTDGGVSNADVSNADAADRQALPNTGSSSTIPMAQVAVAVIAGGGLLILVADKRRSAGRADERTLSDV